MKVLTDIIEERPLSVGFNRMSGGLDVLVPLDISVSRTYEEGGKILRIRSSEAIAQFTRCFLDLTHDLLR
jgi:hypothetical protein